MFQKIAVENWSWDTGTYCNRAITLIDGTIQTHRNKNSSAGLDFAMVVV